jgi:hypothetical protein
MKQNYVMDFEVCSSHSRCAVVTGGKVVICGVIIGTPDFSDKISKIFANNHTDLNFAKSCFSDCI